MSPYPILFVQYSHSINTQCISHISCQDLLTPISDARFHFGRKLTTTDISVLHQACANRPNPHPAVVDIVKVTLISYHHLQSPIIHVKLSESMNNANPAYKLLVASIQYFALILLTPNLITHRMLSAGHGHGGPCQ